MAAIAEQVRLQSLKTMAEVVKIIHGKNQIKRVVAKKGIKVPH
jgi:hypothetical protein